MLDQQKDIDAVVVATPDHLHAPIAMAALDLKKHVYVQKPLTWSVHEARELAKKAQEHQGRDADGQPGSFLGRRPARGRVVVGRRDRRCHAKRTSGPTVRSPTGRRAFRGRSRSAIVNEARWNMSGVMARLSNAMGLYSTPDTLVVGSLPRPGSAGRVSPDLSPVQLARLGRLGRRRHRRHGRAPDRSRLLGARSRASRRSSRRCRRRSTRRASRWRPRRTTSSRRAAASPR